MMWIDYLDGVLIYFVTYFEASLHVLHYFIARYGAIPFFQGVS
jgi:hypothetical protein